MIRLYCRSICTSIIIIILQYNATKVVCLSFNLGKTGERMKMEKVPWDVGRHGVSLRLVGGVRGTERRRHKNMLLGQRGQCTFIISRTFTRGRYSLAV